MFGEKDVWAARAPFRGVLDTAAAAVYLTLTVHFAWLSTCGETMRVALLVFAASQLLLFAASAVYHSRTWPSRIHDRLQRLDHACIYVKVAGAVTPLSLAALDGTTRDAVVGWVWLVASIGVAQKALAPRLMDRGSILAQLAQAASILLVAPAFAARFPGTPSHLLFAATSAYALGAIVFITERPRLWPPYFGFHDFFHVFLALGGCCLIAVAVGTLTQLP